MNTRRNFLAKIFSSAVAAPAVAGIIARGVSRPEVQAMECVGITGSYCDSPGIARWTPATEDVPHELVHDGVRYIREMTATEVNLNILRSTHFPRV